MAIPKYLQLEMLTSDFCQGWVPVTEALPPIMKGVLVMVRGDDAPAWGLMKYGGGDPMCPYFQVPQRAAMNSRKVHLNSGVPAHAKGRTDVTMWYSPSEEGLPIDAPRHYDLEWGLEDGFVLL